MGGHFEHDLNECLRTLTALSGARHRTGEVTETFNKLFDGFHEAVFSRRVIPVLQFLSQAGVTSYHRRQVLQHTVSFETFHLRLSQKVDKLVRVVRSDRVVVDLPKKPHTVGKRDEVRPIDTDPFVVDFSTALDLLYKVLIRKATQIHLCHFGCRSWQPSAPVGAQAAAAALC